MSASSCRSNPGCVASSDFSRARSACSVSACDLTETYSPAPMDKAPLTRADMPETAIADWCALQPANPQHALTDETIWTLLQSIPHRDVHRPQADATWEVYAKRIGVRH